MKMFLARMVLKLARGHDVERSPGKHRLAGWVFRRFPGMITCGQFEAFLIDYHEGDLPQAQREDFERHMKLCGRCRNSVEGYRRAIELNRQLFAGQDGPLPEDVPDQVVAAVISAMNAR